LGGGYGTAGGGINEPLQNVIPHYLGQLTSY